MLRILLLTLIISPWVASHAQRPTSSDSSRHQEYEEVMPVFPGPGGPSALLQFLSDSMHYPKSALRDQMQGTVFITFVVNSEGHTTDIKVKNGVRADLDAEALRVA